MVKLNENKPVIIDGECVDKNDLISLNKLQRELIIEEKIYFNLSECINIWSNYSNDFYASWLFFPDENKSIIEEIKKSIKFTNFEEYSK